MRKSIGLPFRLYFLVTAAFAAAAFLTFAARAASDVRNPAALDYGEGIVLWQAQAVGDLPDAYGRIDGLRNIVFNYSPLYHVVIRFVSLFTGDLLRAGRLVSATAAILISLLAGALVFRVLPRRIPRMTRLSGALTGALLAYSVPSLEWARYVRVDLLANLLAFLGVYLFIAGARRPVLQYAAFFCFFLALFTKQTMIAAPAVCAFVALRRDRRLALRLIALLAGCGSVTLAILAAATQGRILLHLFRYEANPVDVTHFYNMAKTNLLGMQGIAALGLALPVWFGCRAFRRHMPFQAATHSAYRRAVTVLGIYLPAAFIFSFTALKRGSDINYFLEWNLACCPLAGVLVGATLYSWRRRRFQPHHAVILALPLLAGLLAIHLSGFSGQPWKTYSQGSAEALERVRQVKGPVYSEDMTLLYHAHKAVYAEPGIITLLAGRAWDETPFVNRIRSGFFELIVVKSGLWNREIYTPAVAAAIQSAYDLRGTAGDYQLYYRRGAATGRE
ncbi:MAG: hypothetical protein ABSC23_16460 [Bryobacteraceae bacterium]|jgi:hypothetical protein